MKIACIDIGGTYVKSAVLQDGVLGDVTETPTCAEKGGPVLLEKVAGMVRAMAGVARVGVSTAGEVNAATGAIRLCDNIPGYTGMNPKILLQEALGVPVAVENDVNAAAMGELTFGAVRGMQDFLMVSYGTGVGGAAVLNGALYRGSACSAGEFGGLITHPEAVRAENRGSGSYERYASTSALVARVQRVDATLQTGREIFARRDDLRIQSAISAWVNEIAYGLVSLIHAFNPQAIVLGGGVMREEYLLHCLKAVLPSMVKPSFQGCALLPAALGNSASLMGAGRLAELLSVTND